MATLAEIKANTFYFLARSLGEPLLEKVLPSEDTSSSPEDVFQRQLEAAKQKLAQASTPLEQAESLVELIQERINTSHFGPARSSITRLLSIAGGIEQPQQNYFLAKAFEKEGWINDYETGFSQSQHSFSRAKSLLEDIPKNAWGHREDELSSTITHFLGRAHLGMANQGIKKASNLSFARQYFWQDLDRFEKLRRDGIPQSANEGYQHAWLGMCNLLSGDLTEASNEINLAGDFFKESLERNPQSGILAHFHLLQGALYLKRYHFAESRVEFLESVMIRKDKERYPMGEAFALLGVSKTYLGQHRFKSAGDYFFQAIKTQPAILLYALSGRSDA